MTGAAQLDEITRTVYESICVYWTRACDDIANGGKLASEATAAADYFTWEMETGSEYAPTPTLINLFKAFYCGFMQGFGCAEDSQPSIPAAREIADKPTPMQQREIDAARRLAAVTGEATTSDTFAATTLYNLLREEHSGFPFEFLLGGIYYAGIERGRERERSRIKSAARRKAAKQRR